MVGLLGRTQLEAGEGLIFPACQAVHTFGMQFPIAVIFVDGQEKVAALHPDLTPGRMSPIIWRSVWVLELPVGVLAGADLKREDLLELCPSA